MKRIKNIQKSQIARNSLVYTSDFMLQIFVQAAYAILISRELGPSSYGIFAAITAVTIIGSVFAGWGCDQVLIKNVAVERKSFRKNFGSGLTLILVTYPILLAILFPILYSITPQSKVGVLSLILFITADLLFTKIIFLTKACFQAFERPTNQLIINLVTTLTKLLFLFFSLKFSSTFTLEQWSVWYFASGFVSACFGLIYVVRYLGAPQFNNIKTEFIAGMQFCIEQASLAALKDLDKPIIVAVMGSDQGGYYAAAFKIVDAASSPVRGMLNAAYVRYFKFSRQKEQDGILFSFKVLPYLTVVSVVLGILVYSMAWTLPNILGDKYLPAVDIVKQLCLYPLLIGLLGTGVDLLRGIGRQLTRTYIMIFSSLASVPILYFCLSHFELVGAVFAKNFILAGTVTITWWIIYRVKTKL